MLSSAALRAVCDDAAYLQSLSFLSRLAARRGRTACIPVQPPSARSKALQSWLMRSQRAGGGRHAIGQSRDSTGEALTATSQSRCRGRPFYVALGRHHRTRRYRHHAHFARGHRCAADRISIEPSRLRHALRDTRERRVSRAPGCTSLPMSVRLKLADTPLLASSRTTLRRLRRETLANFNSVARWKLARSGDKGTVAAQLADSFDLPLPDAPWHTHRDRIAEAASVFISLWGDMRQDRPAGRIADDATDVAKRSNHPASRAAAPPPCRTKRTLSPPQPALSRGPPWRPTCGDDFAAKSKTTSAALEPCTLIWPTLPTLACSSLRAPRRYARIAEGLEVDGGCASPQPRCDIRADHGRSVAMSLAGAIGKSEAHQSGPPPRANRPSLKRRICSRLENDPESHLAIFASDTSGKLFERCVSGFFSRPDRSALGLPRLQIGYLISPPLPDDRFDG